MGLVNGNLSDQLRRDRNGYLVSAVIVFALSLLAGWYPILGQIALGIIAGACVYAASKANRQYKRFKKIDFAETKLYYDGIQKRNVQ